MSKNVSLEKSLLAYKVMHTSTEFSLKQYWAKEEFSNDELLKCTPEEQERFSSRLEECQLTMLPNIKATTGGKIINLQDVIDMLLDPKRKEVKKIDRNVIYTSANGERPIGQKAYDMWGGFQVIDMDIKDEYWAKYFKKHIFCRLKKYNWFFGVALSSSGKGLHIYTKIQVPESAQEDHLKSKILYLTNFRHKYSFVYLACLKIIEDIDTLSKDDILKWMDMAMFKPQQGAFIGSDDAPLISTHFFEDFIYVNFDNVEDMGHPDVDWVSHPDLKEVFKRWEWFEDDSEYGTQEIEVTDSPDLEIDTKNRYHYKHHERWRLANTLVKLYGLEKGYTYLKMICTADVPNKEIQADCTTASRHDKPIELWAVNRLNKYHGFKIKVNVDHEETNLNEITDQIDSITDPTSLMVPDNMRTIYINKNQYLSDVREEIMKGMQRINLIEAGAGTGKTEMVKKLVELGKRCIMVMPFTSTIKSKVEGDDGWYYSYGNRKVKFDTSPGLAMTVDKFSKINLMEAKEAGYDYIFIDESHLLFQSEYRPVMSKVIEMIRNTEVPIIMMSGTPIGEDIFFPNLNHVKVIKEDVRKKKFDVRLSETPLDSMYMMCKHMANDIAEKKRVLFPTNQGTIYKEKIAALVTWFLEHDHFIFEPPKINYYKKSNLGEEFMNDVNFRKTIKDTDILMCSTYLSVGVDILDKFEFNIYFNDIWTPQEIEQFANRLRSHDLFIRLYLPMKDQDGVSLNVSKYAPCSFKLSDDELKNAHSILRLCNGMIERNPVEYKYNSLISSIITNNKFIEYNEFENKYYLNEIAYKTIFFERKFRAYAQQLPVLIKGMLSYGYEYESKNMGKFQTDKPEDLLDLESLAKGAMRKQKDLNTEHIDELIDMITEDRLPIYKDVMDGKYEIVKGRTWSENVLDHKMKVKNVEMFEKVVPIFVSMSKMYDVEDIKSIFKFCTNSKGDYNFAMINRIRLLINMIYNSKKNRLDVPIQKLMNDTYFFLQAHEIKGTIKCKQSDINAFILKFVTDYAKSESKGKINILLSPLTIEEIHRNVQKIWNCLVDQSRPNSKREVTLKKRELFWEEKDAKERRQEASDNERLFILGEFLDAIDIKKERVDSENGEDTEKKE